jgi:galactokinase
VPLSDQLAIVVADTSIRRKLTSGEYNNRRESCEAAVRRLKHRYPTINSLRDVSVEQLERSAGELDEITLKRARHVVYEIERTRKATELLHNNQFAAFGVLMEECHSSLRDLYEVSCPELDLMTRLAKELPGYLGARLTGAGFGGCTVNLVEKAEAAQFARLLGQRYAEASGLQAQIYICHASDGASIESL